jgi:hypothetical protein
LSAIEQKESSNVYTDDKQAGQEQEAQECPEVEPEGGENNNVDGVTDG